MIVDVWLKHHLKDCWPKKRESRIKPEVVPMRGLTAF